jgi:hypothetical protein
MGLTKEVPINIKWLHAIPQNTMLSTLYLIYSSIRVRILLATLTIKIILYSGEFQYVLVHILKYFVYDEVQIVEARGWQSRVPIKLFWKIYQEYLSVPVIRILYDIQNLLSVVVLFLSAIIDRASLYWFMGWFFLLYKKML